MLAFILMNKKNNMRFNGSAWCNLDIALRNVDHIFRQAANSIGLSPLEWYVLRVLYEKDGQHASELAHAVGRAATSFTPNLDKLEEKGLIERRPDPCDRRAVHIHLTDDGRSCREEVIKSAEDVDARLRQLFEDSDYEAFQRVLAALQTATLD
jgi:DNA-binding MarR family transcriptional regulator